MSTTTSTKPNGNKTRVNDDWVASASGLYDAKTTIDASKAVIAGDGQCMPDVDLEQLCDSILGNLRLAKA